MGSCRGQIAGAGLRRRLVEGRRQEQGCGGGSWRAQGRSRVAEEVSGGQKRHPFLPEERKAQSHGSLHDGLGHVHRQPVGLPSKPEAEPRALLIPQVVTDINVLPEAYCKVRGCPGVGSAFVAALLLSIPRLPLVTWPPSRDAKSPLVAFDELVGFASIFLLRPNHGFRAGSPR